MIKAGAFAIDITPQQSVQLAGYPFVERKSSGVHDQLLASALYIETGGTALLFISCDLIYIGKETAARIRNILQEQYGIPQSHIMLTATHTHSGPATVTFIAGSHDALLEPVDREYLAFLEKQLPVAAGQAIRTAEAAVVGFGIADVTGIGTNRHHPKAAADLNAPVLLVRRKTDDFVTACMVVCSMHPTVLHEDSTLISGDFPGLTRMLLQQQYFSPETVFLFQLGTAGNQSPRHVTSSNSFDEAARLAGILAAAISRSARTARYEEAIGLKLLQDKVTLIRKRFPSQEDAALYVTVCRKVLDTAIAEGRPVQEVRSAEVNWFGAKEMAHLSLLAAGGKLESSYQKNEVAEILIFKIGPLLLIGWPGEIFVEYGLEIKEDFPNAAVITLVNGELQGYIVTADAAAAGVYEASNAIFDASSGALLVTRTKELIKTLE
ncbi:neutral/alkaline non-lysosomal ceramidase N-terminal domain-containing protein [Niabella beijingensis]|uniref:neutral/alkaline non-lysosomal ceramidase N-terminal domain-containing protein n=1 Tax=Niabella beijingensis TaxID=2872700 RepID=UPI001CBCBE3A|nr:neutral/alkaline non-lysosomal ceramidase N-terminal domain-containing protein [Niabella beijingensis]MBZ4190876.1 neutral/alkaline non-lysosomal ceramidase N-terminal domain-containing protein [Niabella beijingensis]